MRLIILTALAMALCGCEEVTIKGYSHRETEKPLSITLSNGQDVYCKEILTTLSWAAFDKCEDGKAYYFQTNFTANDSRSWDAQLKEAKQL
jgi:hypothetical protein